MKLTPFLLLLLSAPAQANSIAGQWTYRADAFSGECAPRGETHESIVTITQTGPKFTATGGLSYKGRGTQYEGIGDGTLNGKSLRSIGKDTTTSWSGTLSQDGNSIQGKASCKMGGGGTGKGEFPFTMQRKSTQTTTVPQTNVNSNGLRPEFDDEDNTVRTQPQAQPPIAPRIPPKPQPSASNPTPSSNITGEWVTFLGTPLSNQGSADRITQTNNQFTLQSGISGQTFTGKLIGDRIETTIPRTSPGKLSPDQNAIQFSDMALVRLGSPTCNAIATCQLP
jgi:hypothetical protein